jgi:hypothetical protein
MRRTYGGKFGQTVRSLARDPVTFGPGWNSSVFATGGVTRAEGYWTEFLGALPPWSAEVTRFLAACRYIGRSADQEHGLVLTDPLDGAMVPWNPVRRARKKLPAGKNHIEVQLPGRLWGKRKQFVPLPWRVDTRELERRVAPCLVHMMDAYFNALVLEHLHDTRGVTQFFAVHDGWFVPEEVGSGLYSDDLGEYSGKQLLDSTIEWVAPEWLSGVGRVQNPECVSGVFPWDSPHVPPLLPVPPDETRPGLRVVYDWFVNSLKGSPYETFAIEVRDRWRQRVTEQRWPKFTAS